MYSVRVLNLMEMCIDKDSSSFANVQSRPTWLLCMGNVSP